MSKLARPFKSAIALSKNHGSNDNDESMIVWVNEKLVKPLRRMSKDLLMNYSMSLSPTRPEAKAIKRKIQIKQFGK